jgi:hypothetical protein
VVAADLDDAVAWARDIQPWTSAMERYTASKDRGRSRVVVTAIPEA